MPVRTTGHRQMATFPAGLRTTTPSDTPKLKPRIQSSGNKKIEWVPVVFIVFKVLVFGTGMFFAIKWHYDENQKNKKK